MTSYLRRQQWLARIQAVEVGKLMMSGGETPADVPAVASNGARYVPPDVMLRMMGVTL